MRLALPVLLLCPLVVPAQSTAPAQPLTVKEKFELHAKRIVHPVPVLGMLAGAGIEQSRGEPYQWGGGMEGYGRRVADAAGFVAAENMFAFALDSTLHQDPRYFRSSK